MKAPFPYFGGKSPIASEVWRRFGDVPNYVEPFAGSLAVLLSRPTEPKTETVNDMDCMIANFWRAVQAEPGAVAKWADWPVNEADLHARHLWLIQQDEFHERMKTDPNYFDLKIAGWWVWGISMWIGTGWCKRPHLGDAGMGVTRKRPHLNRGQGVHRQGVTRQLPHLNRGQGVHRYMLELCDRLRLVRVCCGNWDRVLGPTVTALHGVTGVFLDPPYASTERDDCYNKNSYDVAHAVAQWARENGDNPLLRIALCGYEGEHEMPEDWECVEWKTQGGYGAQSDGQGRKNAHRERVWFSPHCLSVEPVPVQEALL